MPQLPVAGSTLHYQFHELTAPWVQQPQSILFHHGLGSTSGLWSGTQGIFTVPTSGGSSTLVTKKGALPSWGGASDRVYFVTFEDEGGKTALTMRAEPSKSRSKP